MRCRSRSAALGALLLAAAAPCLATHWVEIGSSGPQYDSILVDVDSLRIQDDFRVVEIMTRYAQPRANTHNVTLDRFVQTTGFDCRKHTYSLIRTVGYRGDARVGSSRDVDGWQDKMTGVPDDTLSNRIYSIVCPVPSTAQ